MAGVSESSPGRPRQVTLAAWLIMVGSAIVVAMVFEQVAGLHTLETRTSVEKFLAEPPGEDLGVDVDAVITLLRTAAMVAAGCATAAAILGFHVLRRSRSARLALTVIAVPLFLTGMVTGGFVSSVVAASAAMLWLQPARDWFDGISRPSPTKSTTTSPTTSTTAAAAAPTAPVAPPAGPVPSAVWPAPAAVPERPAAVAWACIVTWICSALTALGMVVAAIALAVDGDELIERAKEQNPDLAAQGVTDAMLLGLTFVMLGGIVLWCLASIALAALVYRGIEWARIVLIVFAATAGVLSLGGIVLGAFLLVFSLAGGTVAAALLLRPEVRPFFRR